MMLQTVTEKAGLTMVIMDLPYHQGQAHAMDHHTFYREPMSTYTSATQSAATVAKIEFMCSCYGFEIDDYNYREVQMMQAQIYRNRQAQRALHRLRNQ
jgi:hypothetical protein